MGPMARSAFVDVSIGILLALLLGATVGAGTVLLLRWAL